MPTTEHTYATASTYTIGLTVTDNDDATSDPYTDRVTVTLPATTVEVPVVADAMVYAAGPGHPVRHVRLHHAAG